MKFITLISTGTLLILLSSASMAAPVSSIGIAGDKCTYAGKTYSDGSRVDQAGKTMKCDDGEWVTAIKRLRFGRVAPRTAGTLIVK